MDDRYFVMFSGEHFLASGISLASAIGLVWTGKRSRALWLDRLIRWGLAAGCLGCQFAIGLYWWRRGYGWRDLLPLHLCDTALFIAPVVLLLPNRFCCDLLYFWGIPGAVVALVTPALHHSFPSVVCVCFFAGHGLILASALYATLVMRLRLTAWSVLRAWLAGNALMLLVIPLNHALGTNYMFVHHKPTTASLLDVLGPWPWYIVAADAVALLAMALCYLPFAILEQRTEGHTLDPEHQEG
jgi:hypothetical integral membrane protein (TIGR02206 family)